MAVRAASPSKVAVEKRKSAMLQTRLGSSPCAEKKGAGRNVDDTRCSALWWEDGESGDGKRREENGPESDGTGAGTPHNRPSTHPRAWEMNQTVQTELDKGGRAPGPWANQKCPWRRISVASDPQLSPVLLGYLRHHPTTAAHPGSIALMRLARPWGGLDTGEGAQAQTEIGCDACCRCCESTGVPAGFSILSFDLRSPSTSRRGMRGNPDPSASTNMCTGVRTGLITTCTIPDSWR